MEPPPPYSTGNESGPGAPADGTHRSVTDKFRDALSKAWESGAEDARRTASESMPRVRQAGAEIAADLAYGLGYGATFAATLLDQLGATAEATRSSERGMDAGRRAAESLIGRFGCRKEPPAPPPREDPQTAP